MTWPMRTHTCVCTPSTEIQHSHPTLNLCRWSLHQTDTVGWANMIGVGFYLAHVAVLDLGIGTQKFGHFLIQPQPHKVLGPLNPQQLLHDNATVRCRKQSLDPGSWQEVSISSNTACTAFPTDITPSWDLSMHMCAHLSWTCSATFSETDSRFGVKTEQPCDPHAFAPRHWFQSVLACCS